MNILVSGSAGYIGANFCHEVLKLNHVVLGVDNYLNSSSSITKTLKMIHKKNFSFLELDLKKTNNFFTTELQSFKPDLVVHFAALKSVSAAELNPDLYWKNNIESTINILEAAKNAGCNKMIFSSSAAVYSKSNVLPVNEKSVLEPESIYGKTKLACENIVKEFCKENSMNAIIFRYFNVSGSHQDKIFFESSATSENLMTKIIDVATGRKDELEVFGDDYNTKDGSATRDYLHIEDLLNAHTGLMNLFSQIEGFEVFNLGSSTETTVLQLLKEFELANGIKVNYKISKSRCGELPRSLSDTSKIKAFSGWMAKKSLQDICFDAWTPNKDEV